MCVCMYFIERSMTLCPLFLAATMEHRMEYMWVAYVCTGFLSLRKLTQGTKAH